MRTANLSARTGAVAGPDCNRNLYRNFAFLQSAANQQQILLQVVIAACALRQSLRRSRQNSAQSHSLRRASRLCPSRLSQNVSCELGDIMTGLSLRKQPSQAAPLRAPSSPVAAARGVWWRRRDDPNSQPPITAYRRQHLEANGQNLTLIPSLWVGSRCGERSFAEACLNGEVAPIPDARRSGCRWEVRQIGDR